MPASHLRFYRAKFLFSGQVIRLLGRDSTQQRRHRCRLRTPRDVALAQIGASSAATFTGAWPVVDSKRIYVDYGLTRTNRDRPGSRQALAACRSGDTLVVTKLDRLARSVPDAGDIVDELTAGVKLNIGGSVHDPTDPIGRLLFTALSMIAEFEVDLARARTREGMAVARAKGRLRGQQPKLSPRHEAHLVELDRAGGHTIGELEELFPATHSTIYRAIARAGGRMIGTSTPGANR